MALNYKELRVYKSAYQAGLKVLKIIPKLQVDVDLKRQLYRAATSVPANIAEGYGRKSNKHDFARFLKYALGSTNEVLVFSELIRDLGCVNEDWFCEIERDFTKTAK